MARNLGMEEVQLLSSDDPAPEAAQWQHGAASWQPVMDECCELEGNFEMPMSTWRSGAVVTPRHSWGRCTSSRKLHLCTVLMFVGLLTMCSVNSFNVLPGMRWAKAPIGNLVGLSAPMPGCTDPGSICICPLRFKGLPLDTDFMTSAGTEHCQQWTFKVGDVLIFGYGPAKNAQMKFVNAFMRLFFKGAVHASIVTEVRGKGKTLADITVTEALKEGKQLVVHSTMHNVLNRRMYHDIWIRRVDIARFKHFADNAATITRWADQRVGEPFDKEMILPGVRDVDPGFVPKTPDCAHRKRHCRHTRQVAQVNGYALSL